MKGPQRACCREFLRRKLLSILDQGRNLAAEFVSARLRGDARVIRFSAVRDEVAESLARNVLSSAVSHVRELQMFESQSIGEYGAKKFNYEIMLVLRKRVN